MPSVPKRTLSAISSPSQSKDGSNHLDGKEVIINTLSSYMLSKDSICVQLEQITRYRDLSRHYSINISLLEMLNETSSLAYEFINNPEETLGYFKIAAYHAQTRLLNSAAGNAFSLASVNRNARAKLNVHGRIKHIPLVDEILRDRMPLCDSRGLLRAVSGTVTRVGPVRIPEQSRIYKCLKCGNGKVSKAQEYLFGQIPKPSATCGYLIDGVRCPSIKYAVEEAPRPELEIKASEWEGPIGQRVDCQEIRIQERSYALSSVGAVPKTLAVLLKHDLVDVCKTGDDVVIVGWLINRWRTPKSGLRADVEFCFEANNVIFGSEDNNLADRNQKSSTTDFPGLGPKAPASLVDWTRKFWACHNDSPLSRRDALINAFAPEIHGLFLVKLAVVLTVIGGCTPSNESSLLENLNTETLENHPSINSANNLCANSVKNQDNQSSSTLLKSTYESSSTASILKKTTNNESDEEDEQLMLSRKHRKEGHLLLVGDPGTAKSRFLLAASQLASRSVLTTGSGSSSAGLTAAASRETGEWQLEAGALVLADRGVCCIDEFGALRKQDKTAIHEAMEQQTLSIAKAGLVCKLQTRCSIIAACNPKLSLDSSDNDGAATTVTDAVSLASPLLSRFDLILMLPDRRDDEWDRSLSGAILEAACSGRHQSRRGIIDRTLVSPDILHSFVNCVRVGGRPGMSPGARIILAKYYQRQRNSDNRDAARTTLRLLESLIRISQAHAKLMLHPNVRMMDAVWAVILVECSLSGAKTLLGSSSSTNLFLEKSGIHNSRIDLYASSAQEPAAQYAEYERIILLALNINPMILEFRNKDNNEETIVNIENLDSEAEDLLTQFTWEPTQRPFD